MIKYRFAYYEACQIMISQSCHLKTLSEIYDFRSMLKPPTEEQFLKESQNNKNNDKPGSDEELEDGMGDELGAGDEEPPKKTKEQTIKNQDEEVKGDEPLSGKDLI